MENKKTFSHPVKKPECIPSNDQHNCSFDKEHTCNIFLNTYNLRDMDPAALKSPNHTNDWDSTSNQYPQTTTYTNVEQTCLRCSFHCERWTARGKDCASALHFSENLPTGRMSEGNSCYS